MKRFVLNRRTLLKGLGAAVALPTLEAMLNSSGTALANGEALPKRLVMWFFGNGVILPKWVPTQTGGTWTLSEELAPLANVKDYVNVISGYRVKTPNLRGHHNGQAGILSGFPFIELPAGTANYSSKFGGPSLDQVVADRIAGATPYKSLQLAVSKRVTRGEGPTLQYCSHRGPDAPLAPEFNPVNLYTRLFGNFQVPDTTDPRNDLRVSVLDRVNEDIKRLQGRLGSVDRARLDAHLTSISEVRQQILSLSPELVGACELPPEPTETNTDTDRREPITNVNRVFSDLMAIAFACDLTRVVSMQFTGSVGGQVYTELGQTDNNHNITHDAGAQNLVHDGVVYAMERFGYLCDKLRATPEGTGNLLDQSLLMCTSDVAEGLAHSISNYPIALVGKAGGSILYPGIHHRSTTAQNTSDVLLTVARAVGADIPSVGGGDGFSSTACLNVMA